mgnify:CR=1 FL=1
MTLDALRDANGVFRVLAIDQAALHRGLAHALDDLLHEDGLELLGRFLQRGALVLGRQALELVQRAGVHRQVVAGHCPQLT